MMNEKDARNVIPKVGDLFQLQWSEDYPALLLTVEIDTSKENELNSYIANEMDEPFFILTFIVSNAFKDKKVDRMVVFSDHFRKMLVHGQIKKIA